MAAKATFGRDLARVFLLAMVWAIIWFALTLIECILSKNRGNDDADFNAENAAKTLAGYGTFSLSRAFFDALEKGVRMVVFLILPAVAWNDMGVVAATKKGFSVLRAHLGDFARGYALTYAAAGIIFLPPGIVFELGTGRHGNPPLIHFPDLVWFGVILYIGFAWSFCMYLEQLFMAQLYLWNMKWEAAQAAARKQNLPLPLFQDVDQPFLLAKAPSLLD